MQPSTASGRNLRLALMPLALLVSFGTVVATLRVVALLRSSSLAALLRIDSYWMLALILPSMFLGFVIGLIATNLVAFATPPFRRTFELECQQTGRHSFRAATAVLALIAVLFFATTVAGVVAFIHFVP